MLKLCGYHTGFVIAVVIFVLADATWGCCWDRLDSLWLEILRRPGMQTQLSEDDEQVKKLVCMRKFLLFFGGGISVSKYENIFIVMYTIQ